MDPEQLWETTMDPAFPHHAQGEHRGCGSTDEAFTILMGDKVEPRKEFIEKECAVRYESGYLIAQGRPAIG